MLFKDTKEVTVCYKKQKYETFMMKTILSMKLSWSEQKKQKMI